MPQVPEGHLATQTYLYIPGKTGQAAAEPLPWESETSENPRASPLPGYKLLGTPSCGATPSPGTVSPTCLARCPGTCCQLSPRALLCSRRVQAPLQMHTNAALPFLSPSRSTAHPLTAPGSGSSWTVRVPGSSPAFLGLSPGKQEQQQEVSSCVWAEHPCQSPSPPQPPL